MKSEERCFFLSTRKMFVISLASLGWLSLPSHVLGDNNVIGFEMLFSFKLSVTPSLIRVGFPLQRWYTSNVNETKHINEMRRLF